MAQRQSLRLLHLSPTPSSSSSSSFSLLSSLLVPSSSSVSKLQPSPRLPLSAAAAAQHALRRRSLAGVRHASKASASPGTDRTRVLEKPLQFNPPSHGSRLPSKLHVPKHYAAPLSAGERAAQDAREYPGMMAPAGTWAHWFWHNKFIHLFITMGTLLILAIATYAIRFTHTSPFRHLLPPNSEIWTDPAHFVTTWFRVMLLHERDRNERVGEDRRRGVEDALKRRQFQKAHGLDKQSAIVNFFGGSVEDEPEAKPQENADAVVATPVAAATAETHSEALAASSPPPEAVAAQETKPRRWFGIF